MKTHELLKQLQKLIAEHPEAVDPDVWITFEVPGKTLGCSLDQVYFRLTNLMVPTIVLKT